MSQRTEQNSTAHRVARLALLCRPRPAEPCSLPPLRSSSSPVNNPINLDNNGKGRTAERTDPPTNRPRTEETTRDSHPALLAEPTNTIPPPPSFCAWPPRCRAAPRRRLRPGAAVEGGREWAEPTTYTSAVSALSQSATGATPSPKHNRRATSNTHVHTHAPLKSPRIPAYACIH